MRVLDMFCGAGGGSAGARAAGANVVAGIDMCAIATETFAANFPEARVFTGRLEDIPLDSLRRKIGDIDILLASPECTNHSCAKGAAPPPPQARRRGRPGQSHLGFKWGLGGGWLRLVSF